MPESHHSPYRHGAGRLCLDFIRTLRYRGRPGAEEELSTDARLREWILQFGPWEEAAELEESGLVPRCQELREAIASLLAAARGDGACSIPDEARETVNAAAAAAVPRPWLDAAGRIAYRSESPVTATLSLVARDALDLVSSPELRRVRPCANPDCQILFLDNSRPGRRRWCSMNTCGNRAKKAAQRAVAG